MSVRTDLVLIVGAVLLVITRACHVLPRHQQQARQHRPRHDARAFRTPSLIRFLSIVGSLCLWPLSHLGGEGGDELDLGLLGLLLAVVVIATVPRPPPPPEPVDSPCQSDQGVPLRVDGAGNEKLLRT